MDYLEMLDLVRHISWDAFRKVPGGRLVLLTTTGDVSHVDFAFQPDDRIVAKAPAYRRRSMTPPTRESAFRCARASARSMSRRPPR